MFTITEILYKDISYTYDDCIIDAVEFYVVINDSFVISGISDDYFSKIEIGKDKIVYDKFDQDLARNLYDPNILLRLCGFEIKVSEIIERGIEI